jgi:hypothetical protein
MKKHLMKKLLTRWLASFKINGWIHPEYATEDVYLYVASKKPRYSIKNLVSM